MNFSLLREIFDNNLPLTTTLTSFYVCCNWAVTARYEAVCAVAGGDCLTRTSFAMTSGTAAREILIHLLLKKIYNEGHSRIYMYSFKLE